VSQACAYKAISALSWQVGFALGPAVGSFMVDYSPSGVWIAAAACCAIGGAFALVVEGTLPTRGRRTPVPVAA
jgi:MFS family permease